MSIIVVGTSTRTSIFVPTEIFCLKWIVTTKFPWRCEGEVLRHDGIIAATNRNGVRSRSTEWRIDMARKSKMTRVAERIGTAVGRADRTAHKIAKAGVIAKKELEDISMQVEALKRQLLKTTRRLKSALR
jgi:hypothetical protein